jgi:DNA-binding transcriptional ArsR family regulator
LLRGGERPVTELARDLGMSPPQASKHLRVLREVGLVRVRGAGKQRLSAQTPAGCGTFEWLDRGLYVAARPVSPPMGPAVDRLRG